LRRCIDRNVIHASGSRSILVPTPARAVKATLSALDRLGRPVMYREQYAIADIDCIVDIGQTEAALGWTPRYSDGDMLSQAYDEFVGRQFRKAG
jgi:dTDP-glucose 4,6-dehydratase